MGWLGIVIFLISVFSSDTFETNTVKLFWHLIDRVLLLVDQVQHGAVTDNQCGEKPG